MLKVSEIHTSTLGYSRWPFFGSLPYDCPPFLFKIKQLDEEEAALNVQPNDLCSMSRLIHPAIRTTSSILALGISTTKFNLSTLIIPLNAITI